MAVAGGAMGDGEVMGAPHNARLIHQTDGGSVPPCDFDKGSLSTVRFKAFSLYSFRQVGPLLQHNTVWVRWLNVYA